MRWGRQGWMLYPPDEPNAFSSSLCRYQRAGLVAAKIKRVAYVHISLRSSTCGPGEARDAKALFSLALWRLRAGPSLTRGACPAGWGQRSLHTTIGRHQKQGFQLSLKVPHVELLIFPKGRRHLRRERAKKFQESGRVVAPRKHNQTSSECSPCGTYDRLTPYT